MADIIVDAETGAVDVFLEDIQAMTKVFTSGMPYVEVEKLVGTLYYFSDVYINTLIATLASGYMAEMSEPEKRVTLLYNAWVTDKPADELMEALQKSIDRVNNGESANEDIPVSTLVEVTGA